MDVGPDKSMEQSTIMRGTKVFPIGMCGDLHLMRDSMIPHLGLGIHPHQTFGPSI